MVGIKTKNIRKEGKRQGRSERVKEGEAGEDSGQHLQFQSMIPRPCWKDRQTLEVSVVMAKELPCMSVQH